MSESNPFLEPPRSPIRRRRGREAAWAGGCLLLGAGGWLLWDRLRSPAPPPAAGTASSPGTAPVPGPPSGPAPGVLVKLPADEAPHRNHMEWWYYNGHLEAADGRVFSFHYVYFLVNSVVPYTAAQLSLVDHQTRQRHAHAKSSPGNPSAGATRGFAFDLGGWVMQGSDGVDVLRAGTADFGLDLRLTDAGPTVFHGGTGLLDFKEAGSSWYYSRPRMAVEGTLRLDAPVAVKGTAWFDHQWGDFQPLKLGWDWFSLRLEDGSDLMLYKLREGEERVVLAAGTLSQGGSDARLGPGDFQLQPLRTWRSPATGVVYTIAWRLTVPSRRLDVELQPVLDACEFDGRDSTLMTYWEGPVRVSGTHAGRGFQEICPLRPARPKPGT
ncbi:MAG: lipocalin family protein [Holophagaceae bacterium]